MTHRPTSELVLIAWLKGVAGLPAGQIGTTLPADATKYPAGFIQVGVSGGSPDRNLPVRRPVLGVDVWVPPTNANKARVPWGAANVLADHIVTATWGAPGRVVSIAVGDFADARVLDVACVTEPRRVPGDASGFARYAMDLELDWVLAGSAAALT